MTLLQLLLLGNARVEVELHRHHARLMRRRGLAEGEQQGCRSHEEHGALGGAEGGG